MARPIEFDRDAAIDGAMHEIWRVGYEAASVKALSEKLGITRSSFYNAFGSREALFQLALERYFSQTPERALMEMTPETPLKPVLTEVLRAVCRRRANDPDARGCMAANALAELLPANEGPGAAVKRLADSTLDRLTQLVRWASQRSELPKDTDARGLALALHSMIIGINTQSKFIRREADLWRSASTTLKALGLYADLPPSPPRDGASSRPRRG